jgi:hypothetical protein
LVIVVFILFSPGFLYGFYPLPSFVKTASPVTSPEITQEVAPEPEAKAADSPRLYLNEEDVSELLNKIESFMD